MKLPKYWINNPNRLKRNRFCELCGVSEIKTGKKLNKHHLIPRDPKGDNTGRFKTISLCKPCHRYLHKAFDNKTLRKYGKFGALPVRIVKMSLEEAKDYCKGIEWVR